ncbi:hypothetical protein [Cupriavidus sp. BIC8F]|uniref:hypothetical protein n=1 Tax=Cupriavidus sp. BIC8F TaxID=3079014 RepID=UPI00291689FB|nr:hypothetical protein [Cupriavidus sp. BIC8F]
MPDPRDPPIDKLLTQLLSVISPEPELGARLKQRLNAALVANGLGTFDEKALGFRKFTDYLIRVHGHLVAVQRPEGAGDILVSLKHSTPMSRAVAHEHAGVPAPSTTSVIRTAVWQAFANPDPDRKRFLGPNGRIVHYLESSDSEARQAVEAAPEQYTQIEPISQATQGGWMREFLETAPLGQAEKSALEPMIGEPYSSTLNATFTRALGTHGQAWSRFRTTRVTDIIQQWVRAHDVDDGVIYTQRPSTTTSELGAVGSVASHATASLAAGPMPISTGSARDQVLKLLELIADEDLERVVLPLLLSTIMIKSRM